MPDRNEWFKDLKRLVQGLEVETVEDPFAWPTVTSVADGEDVLHALGLHEPTVEDVRERSLDRPNVMSVTCPSCGMSNSIAWGSLMATPQKEAVAMLADSWNSR